MFSFCVLVLDFLSKTSLPQAANINEPRSVSQTTVLLHKTKSTRKMPKQTSTQKLSHQRPSLVPDLFGLYRQALVFRFSSQKDKQIWDHAKQRP